MRSTFAPAIGLAVLCYAAGASASGFATARFGGELGVGPACAGFLELLEHEVVEQLELGERSRARVRVG